MGSFESRAAAIVPEAVSVISISPEQCDVPIFDENSSQTNEALEVAVAKLEAKGISTHVQLLQRIFDEDKDYRGDDLRANGKHYVNDLIQACEWDSSNTLTVLVVGRDRDSLQPKLFNLDYKGRQEDYWLNHLGELSDIEADFVSDLKDGNETSYQSDVAHYLNNIYAAEFPRQTQNPGIDPGVDVPSGKPHESVDIPLVPIGSALLGAAVVGAAIARFIRGRTIKHERAEFDADFSAKNAQVAKAFDAATSDDCVLNILQPDDAAHLRALSTQVSEGYGNWRTEYDEVISEINAEKKRLWPRRNQVDVSQAEFSEETNQYLEAAAEFNNELAQLEQKIADVDENIATTAHNYADTVARVGALQTGTHPYKTDYLKQKLDSIYADITEAKSLRFKQYVEKPYDLAAACNAALIDIDTFIAELPDFHRQLAERATATAAAQQERAASLQETDQTFELLQEEYAASCWEDIATNGSTSHDLYNNNDELITTVGSPAENFDIAALVTIDEQLNEIADNHAAIDTKVHEVAQRAAVLAELKTTLPGILDQRISDQESLEQFVNQYPEDIEDDTEADIVKLHETLLSAEQALAKDKPDLLHINDALDSLHSRIGAASDKAHAERAEMVEMREELEDLPSKVSDAIRQARSYEASHSDVEFDTEQEIAQLDLPDAPRARSRQGLRKAIELYREALQDAEEALRDARADVERAEEKERRARLARQSSFSASSSISSPISFGGGFGGGGGGGGINHGGGF